MANARKIICGLGIPVGGTGHLARWPCRRQIARWGTLNLSFAEASPGHWRCDGQLCICQHAGPAAMDRYPGPNAPALR